MGEEDELKPRFKEEEPGPLRRASPPLLSKYPFPTPVKVNRQRGCLRRLENGEGWEVEG